jgi:hypothetical protein
VTRGTLNVAGDVDYYSFQLDAGDVLVADIEARTGNFSAAQDNVLRLRDSLGTVVASSNNAYDFQTGLKFTDPNFAFVATTAGNYTLEVDNNTTQTGQYLLILDVMSAAPEVEPNNTTGAAQAVPLGFDPGESGRLRITGAGATGTSDFFSFIAQPGDVFLADVDSAGEFFPNFLESSDGAEDNTLNAILTLREPGGSVIRINDVNTDPDSGSATNDPALGLTLFQAGTYTLEVSAAAGAGRYVLGMELTRPPLEDANPGDHQILFLDFDGAAGVTIPAMRADNGQPITNVTVPAFDATLFGFTAAQQNPLIDAILGRIAANYAMPLPGAGGPNPAYAIEIRNSRDHADPWGQPNVTRVLIGGTGSTIGIAGIYGIAESIDTGNRDTTESAFVLAAEFTDVASVPARFNNANTTVGALNVNDPAQLAVRINAYANALGHTISHEAGHTFGLWHHAAALTDGAAHTYLDVMDTGSGTTLNARAGAGPDARVNTADDVVAVFGTSESLTDEELFVVGATRSIQSSRDTLAWNLTGTPAISATPTAVDLEAASDAGGSSSDDLTNLDNSSPAAALQFSVSGTVAGATVTIYADGVAIGSAVASGATTSVTTNGSTDLLDGGRTITARQTEPGKPESPDSPSLLVTIETVAPSVTLEQAFGQADATTFSPIHFTAVFSEPVFGFANGDVTLAGTALATTAVITQTGPMDGTTWDIAVSGMTAIGTVIASLNAGIATDAAGNLSAASSSADNTVTYDPRGDWNRDGSLTNTDIQAMLDALVDLEGYQASHNLSDDELRLIGDVNNDGAVTNADIQALLDLLTSGGGGGQTESTQASTATVTITLTEVQVQDDPLLDPLIESTPITRVKKAKLVGARLR